MQPAPVVMTSTGFNEQDQKYKCCCQSCHIKQGAMIIGIVEAVCIGLQLLGSLGGGEFVTNIVPIMISAAVLGCLFYGLKEERPGFLIPHLVVQVLSMVGIVILCIAVGIAMAVGGGFLITMVNQQQKKRGGEQIDTTALSGVIVGVGIAAIGLFIIILVLNIWCFTVILGCYRYLNDKKNMVQVPMTFTQPAFNTGYQQQAAGAPASYGYAQQQAPPPSYDYKQ